MIINLSEFELKYGEIKINKKNAFHFYNYFYIYIVNHNTHNF